ncbi:MAG: alpha/beta hydrolase [Lachnospiraceae bacterium]|nr:alpha/beta hydrolase [Lachnospiraceae bacterium]
MQTQQIEIADYTCNLFLPKDYNESGRHYPVIYVNGDVPIEEIVNEIRKSGHEADFILLSIQPESWNDDFTPWGAPAFRKGEDAPAGRADVYISRLTSEIKPYMDVSYRTKPEPEYTALFGYSLGGLAAAYAMYKTDLFGTVASLSGSLWYDGFIEFMEKEQPVRKDMKVYLSLGKKESLSRNPRMCKVAECTERVKGYAGKTGRSCLF